MLVGFLEPPVGQEILRRILAVGEATDIRPVGARRFPDLAHEPVLAAVVGDGHAEDLGHHLRDIFKGDEVVAIVALVAATDVARIIGQQDARRDFAQFAGMEVEHAAR